MLLFTRAESSVHNQEFEECRTALKYQYVVEALHVMVPRFCLLAVLCVSRRSFSKYKFNFYRNLE
jgi:hypothetical protein